LFKDFSKLEEKKMELIIEEFSIRDIVGASLKIVSFEAIKKSIELICDIDPNVQDIVEGDRIRFRQIMVNLLNNAIKFSNSDTGIVIVKASSRILEEEENNVELQFSVKDNGIGISKDVAKNLFKPFTQADISVTRKFVRKLLKNSI
jgi:two-component system sensor histidine kinase/response regulator